MKTKALAFGKAAQKKTKFKSAKGNELSASDKTFIKNNIERFPVSALANRIGKSVELIEKFLKQNDLGNFETSEKNLVSTPKEEIIEIELTEPKKAEKKEIIKPFKENQGKLSPSELEARRRFFAENCKKMTLQELAVAKNVSKDTVMRDLKILGLNARKYKVDIEASPAVNYVKKNYRTKTNQEMADFLGISMNEVRNICARLKLVRTVEETQAIRFNWRRKSTTEEQNKFIFENYGVIPTTQIREILGITPNLMYRAVKEMGLTITKEQLSKLMSRPQKKKVKEE